MVNNSTCAIEKFLDLLSNYSGDRVFNPWANNCEYADSQESFKIRRKNLRSVLYACSAANDVDIWIGRDLGWRGGRRTGVALVDESTLDDYARSIAASCLTKATIGPPMRERTATEIHLARARVSRKIFFWNVFPFHPHEANKPQSNRMHTPLEREVGLKFLNIILEMLPASRLITIGNDATNAINDTNLKCHSVRHPSYGGQKDFHSQIDTHYSVARPQALKQKEQFQLNI